MGAVILILWVALVLLTMLGIIIAGVLSMFLKAPKRLFAIDALLILATVLIALTLAANYLPTNALGKVKVKSTSSPEAVIQANLAVQDISQTKYSNELPEPARSIVLFEDKTTLQETLEQSEKQVQALVDKYPTEPQLTSRLAIVQHYENKPTEPTFAHYYERGGAKNFQLDTLRQLYNEPGSNSESEYIKAIESKSLSDWYQQTALIDVYRVCNKAALKTALENQEQKSQTWRFKYLIYFALDLAIVLVGIATIGWFLRSKKTFGEFIPLTTEFRKVYGCIISIFFVETFMTLVLGFVFGFYGAITHTTVNLSTHKQLTNSVLVISAAGFSIFMYYFLVCRPKSVSLLSTFTNATEKLSVQQMSIICGAGFSAMLCINEFAQALESVIPGAGHSTNPTKLDMVNAFFSGDILMIVWSIVLVCLIAPFTEELLFRGMLYGWLRNRFGIMPSVLASAVCFALCHFDPSGFVQYFGMGIVLASVYERTRNLWVSTIVHGLWNGWVVVLTWWLTAH